MQPCLALSPKSSVQLLSHVRLFATPWTATRPASLSITNSQSLFKLRSIQLVMPSNHLILYHPLLLLPSVFPSKRVFSDESVLRIRWPKYWSFSFSISPSNEYSGLISFRMNWLDLLAGQESSQSCLTFCNPIDCCLPGTSVHGIFQARVLEWVAISFSRGYFRPRDQTHVFRIADRRFTVWATRKALFSDTTVQKHQFFGTQLSL